MDYALGVDIGGTKISVTLGNSRGKILSQKSVPTLTGKLARRGINELAQSLYCLKSQIKKPSRIVGVGIGIPGPMDPQRGIVQRSPHLKGWAGFPLKSFLQRKLRLPVFITNDANAAAVGEKVFGRGRSVKNFVYLTVSTGVGGGIILNNELWVGASFGAGEIGHTIIFPDGEKCGCGHRGCLEAYASGTAIANYVRAQIHPSKRGLTPFGFSAEKIAASAAKGDRLALKAFKRAGYFLGMGLANLINILNPEMLIVGGSVTKSSRFFWPEMIHSARTNAWPTLYSACRIVKTRLGDRVGDLGALALAFAHLR